MTSECFRDLFCNKDTTSDWNYLRFRISPDMAIAVGTIVMGQTDAMEGQPVEMIASSAPSPAEMAAYERFSGDAMVGDPRPILLAKIM